MDLEAPSSFYFLESGKNQFGKPPHAEVARMIRDAVVRKKADCLVLVFLAEMPCVDIDRANLGSRDPRLGVATSETPPSSNRLVPP